MVTTEAPTADDVANAEAELAELAASLEDAERDSGRLKARRDELVATLVRGGQSDRVIADKAGISNVTVFKIRHRLGLKPGGGKGAGGD